MQVGINIRVFEKPNSKCLVKPKYYKKEFSKRWYGPLLPIGTKVDVMSCQGKVVSCVTNLSSVEMTVEIGVKDQEEFNHLLNHLVGLDYIACDVS